MLKEINQKCLGVDRYSNGIRKRTNKENKLVDQYSVEMNACLCGSILREMSSLKSEHFIQWCT